MQKNSNKVALITGAFGQDGKFLKSLLLKEKYSIIEIGSKRSFYNDVEINHYNILNEKDVKKLLNEYSIKGINSPIPSFLQYEINSFVSK